MIKEINKLMLGLVLLCCISSGAFANAYGYFWIAGANFYYDDINYADTEMDYVLKADKKQVPDVNRIIRIEAKNKMYSNFQVVNDISREYVSLVKQEKCGNGRFGFTSYMTNYVPECSVDNAVKNMKNNYIGGDLYFELTFPIKAKVLGYVPFGYGMFILVEQIEVLKK
jgi:hypothetical protein